MSETEKETPPAEDEKDKKDTKNETDDNLTDEDVESFADRVAANLEKKQADKLKAAEKDKGNKEKDSKPDVPPVPSHWTRRKLFGR